MKNISFTFLFVAIGFFAFAQKSDSTVVKSIFDYHLTSSNTHENLRYLCKNIGARLSGSAEAEEAVNWGKKVLEGEGFDTVYLQPVDVVQWNRGKKEAAWIYNEDQSMYEKLDVLALGGSIGTNGTQEAEVIEISSVEEIEKYKPEDIKGKIVFFNRRMNEKLINTFNAYGGCYSQRGEGASTAVKYGAVGVVIRSLSLKTDGHAHTGTMSYDKGGERIPAAAMSNREADLLSANLKKGKVFLKWRMNCEVLPSVKSYNVIAEIKGQKDPSKVIAVGGHLDSWDVGEGAHDDGAGVVQSMEVLRTYKQLGIRPNYTIRVVLFINEENGNDGGEKYAELAKTAKTTHIAAVESDRGGFVPRGFYADCTKEQLIWLKQFEPILEPYNLHFIKEGFSGVDVSPLENGKIMLLGLGTDSQRYFDFHHAHSDVFEAVNKRELELGAASLSAIIYLIDKNFK